MNLTSYWLKHPVIACVLNAMIIIIGLLCFDRLSVREYPDIHFPKVTIQTIYPNASASLVERTITDILEDQLAGVGGIDSMTSYSRHGQSEIILAFKLGMEMDQALLQIREAIGLAMLPKEVLPPRVERQRAADGIPFIVLALESSSMEVAELTHYANLHLRHPFRSIQGVASAQVWGQPYTYRIVLDPLQMYAFGVNADEVYDALQQHNLSLPVGKFQHEVAATLNSELRTVQDYEQLVVKPLNRSGSNATSASDPMGHAVLLKDIGRITLDRNDQEFRVHINGKPGLCLGILKSSDANPLEVSNAVRATLEATKTQLPEGLKFYTVLDKADFIRYSLHNIEASVVEAVLCVLLVIYAFLRNIRATLIPFVTIPISFLGALTVMYMTGCSINILTLLAMVLAIGLVVDDAIVVLENIQRHRDAGLSAPEAAMKGAKEIGFAIVAMTLTLTSVYAPLAFLHGATGQLFTEFAVALAGGVLVSGVVALTLSPWMCQHVLRPHARHKQGGVDTMLARLVTGYEHLLAKLLPQRMACLGVMGLACVTMLWLMQALPQETAPKEDRNLVGVHVPYSPGQSMDRLEEIMGHMEQRLSSIPEAEHHLVFLGHWGGSLVLPLLPQSQRTRSADRILEAIRPLVASFPSTDAYPWNWDSGLPTLEDERGGDIALAIASNESYEHLFEVVEQARATLEKQSFRNLAHDLQLNTPRYRIDMDSNAMSNLNITPRKIAKMVEVFFSGDQSLTFTKDGMLYPITLEGTPSAWELAPLTITTPSGKRISLAAVASLSPEAGPDTLFHYNHMRAVILHADLPPNRSLGEMMPPYQDAVKTLLGPSDTTIWTGAAKSLGESEHDMLWLMALAVVFVFAILAVQFENLLDPFIILLTVPLACSGALLLLWIMGGSINIYTQIGLITLIGLITKHGILIVEFANQLSQQPHMSVQQAVIQAASLRLRPILMTTAAMVVGTLPLMLSNDAGHEAQQAIGTVLVGGLVVGTCFTLGVLPTVYLMLKPRFPSSVD